MTAIPWFDPTARRFPQQAPEVDYWSLRIEDSWEEALTVRQGIVQPLFTGQRSGAMVNVIDGGGCGYAATSDLSPAGLAAAAERARRWAHSSAAHTLLDVGVLPRASGSGDYRTPVIERWDSVPLNDKVSLLQDACAALRTDPRIVDWLATLRYRRTRTLLLTSAGAQIVQELEFIHPGLLAVANEGSETQQRSGGGWDVARQGGLEQLARVGFPDQAARLAAEALELLTAPECPSGRMDLVLMPAQMVLQIHESIGHPLELDRILGDERNYAGTSFVTLDMFGSYRYGSELLNVTFDPGPAEELASYGYDDEGTRAERVHLIRDGILQRPLGGASSQARSGLPATANARACAWNRPPIDRMANLNLEPGECTLQELIGAVESGVLMDTNRSWSIDDSRNKFQFGCELGRRIENGELKGLVRNPNYRGISATFWRNLTGVGDLASFEVRGVTNCGKGEPNQAIYVGHASSPCRFRDVEVFGGE